MHIFIVNLKRATEKREAMLKQLQMLEISDYEFVTAIDGSALSPEYLDRNVLDYPQCALTAGEIGCALSHLNIYQQMIQKCIPYALVLEDDVVIPTDIKNFLYEIASSINKPFPKIITLGKGNKISLLKRFFTYQKYTEYTAVTAFGTYAYLINLEAAKSLYANLMPIKYEADMTIHFRENGWIKEFNILYPQYIHLIGEHEELSDINNAREPLKKQRHLYKKKLLASRPLMIRIKNRFRRAIWRIKQIKQ